LQRAKRAAGEKRKIFREIVYKLKKASKKHLKESFQTFIAVIASPVLLLYVFWKGVQDCYEDGWFFGTIWLLCYVFLVAILAFIGAIPATFLYGLAIGGTGLIFVLNLLFYLLMKFLSLF
jgi:hypothetical protein